jgi:2-dehydro-3-deoxyphosphogluconate aldolase/(4S)-4-hydroxy-2-oxoglutarate aldolase
MNQILQEFSSLGIIPVIAIDSAQDAEPRARALVDGGLPCAEVTFRTAAARESIERIARAFPAMYLGAGTVLTIDQVKAAVESGAKYVVSPGTNQKTVEYCLANNIPVTPGIATPTEIEMALELGLDVVKFFPAEPLGGIPYLKAISAPYRGLKFIPTGGIDESNLLSYLKLPSVIACGGSWMVKAELINAKRFDEIQRLTAQVVTLRNSLSK